MYRIALSFLAASVLLAAVSGQESGPLSLHRVNGVDGKPWPIKAFGRVLGPEIQTFDAPYVLTPGALNPALWFLDGDQCVPVTYSPTAKRLRNMEVVHSGPECYLTYVVDGMNEFWWLDGAKAAQVTLGATPFSQRARITKRGDRSFLYHGDAEGNTSLYELKEGAAEPVKVGNVDLGTISYAWTASDRLLAAFYRASTYDFYLLGDTGWTPAWDGNGAKEFEEQADFVLEMRAGERLFLRIARRDESEGLWFFDGSKLVAVHCDGMGQDSSSHLAEASNSGLYLLAAGAVYLADGAAAQRIKIEGKPSLMTCRGGSVLVHGTSSWLITGTSVSVLDDPDLRLIAYIDGRDVLRGNDGAMLLYRDGVQVGELKDLPADFGRVERAWQHNSGAYWIEETDPESPNYRLWFVR